MVRARPKQFSWRNGCFDTDLTSFITIILSNVIILFCFIASSQSFNTSGCFKDATPLSDLFSTHSTVRRRILLLLFQGRHVWQFTSEGTAARWASMISQCWSLILRGRPWVRSPLSYIIKPTAALAELGMPRPTNNVWLETVESLDWHGGPSTSACLSRQEYWRDTTARLCLYVYIYTHT